MQRTPPEGYDPGYCPRHPKVKLTWTAIDYRGPVQDVNHDGDFICTECKKWFYETFGKKNPDTCPV